MQESESGKRGNLSASENLFLASYCMLSLTYPESLDLKRKEWCFLFIYLHLIFFLPTILCYTIISLLMKLINYGESCLRMYCFTRKHSQRAMTFWLNCLSHLSELKADMSDKPSICKPVPSGVKKYVVFLWRVLERFTDMANHFVVLSKAQNLETFMHAYLHIYIRTYIYIYI